MRNNFNLPDLPVESGFWSPIFMDSSFSDGESQTASVSAGKYIKIGDYIFFHGDITMTSFGTLTTASQAYIGNLPYLSRSGSSGIGGACFTTGGSLALTGATENLTGNVNGASRVIGLYTWDSTNGTTAATLDDISANGSVTFFGFYTTN